MKWLRELLTKIQKLRWIRDEFVGPPGFPLSGWPLRLKPTDGESFKAAIDSFPEIADKKILTNEERSL